MAIWKLTPNPSVEAMNALVRDTAVSTLGIVFTEVGEDFLRATMPVDSRTVQPARILHGGASVLLAETIGSQAAYMCVDPSAFRIETEDAKLVCITRLTMAIIPVA